MCKLAVALILKHIVVLKKNNDREWLLEGFLQKETTIKKLRQKPDFTKNKDNSYCSIRFCASKRNLFWFLQQMSDWKISGIC